jgi:hypothetical protein
VALRQIMIDDIDLTEGAETRTFSLDGVTYEIDLNDMHYRELCRALDRFIDSGRRQTATKSKQRKSSETPKAETPKAKPVTQAALNKEQSEAIREWARKQGHKVSSRGRIPRDIVNQFNSDHTPRALEFSS